MKMLLCWHDRTCMGTAALAASSLLWATTSYASSVTVVNPPCAASSQRARIEIVLEEKPATNAQLVVTTHENRLIQTLSVDKSGLVVLPRLAPGKYDLTASAPGTYGASICVEIPEKKLKQVSSFSLALQTPLNMLAPWLLTEAENKAPRELIREFKGVVLDQSGGGVSGMIIQVLPRGVRDDARSIKTITDPNGQFAVHLADGIYTALFVFPGFHSEIMVFEITQAGAAKDLRVPLKVGSTT
jgi:hypothetical protein